MPIRSTCREPGGPESLLASPVQYRKGVGPAKARLLAKLGVHTVGDLLRHYPRRHEDRSNLAPIAALVPGTTATVRVVVQALSNRRPRPRFTMTHATVIDGTGELAVVWFNQPYLVELLNPGDVLYLHGRVGEYKGRPQMQAPEFEKAAPPAASGDEPDTGEWSAGESSAGESSNDTAVTGLVPFYPLTLGLDQWAIRRLTRAALDDCAGLVPEFLGDALRGRRGLAGAEPALRGIHLPGDPDELAAARRRLVYEEFFLLEVALALRRRQVKHEECGIAFKIDRRLHGRIRNRLPFTLTAAQERVVGEVCRDMAEPSPMQRLVQGDVGSGKTAVALYAILACVANRRQAAFMAPTEILAEQHFLTLSRYLQGSRVRAALLTGTMRGTERRQVHRGLAAGDLDLVVGTHALTSEGLEFHSLGLAVVDEQHRFGVLQRARLASKGERPDILQMTATPIPRSLAMTVFGDLDVSVIDALPPGRQPVETRWVRRKGERAKAMAYVRRRLDEGRQAYVVFPLIEESETVSAAAAEEGYSRIAEKEFPGVPVALLTGRMPAEERGAVMEDFRAGRSRILVATSVIEVGIDVPNATVMVIESAERFGLASLHQLRGRIGRGTEASTCLLFGNPSTPEGQRRLELLCETSDGFRIAEEDLRMRGPGEFMGTRQSGLPELRLADPVADEALLLAAREDAFAWVEGRLPAQAVQAEALDSAFRDRFRDGLRLLGVG